jgi:rsbT antagonist protein RsbS
MELRRLPIIKLWDRIVVPIQGEITDELAELLCNEVLKVIHESGARGLVLDLTGVWIMDSHLCSVISNLAAAARLMGTPTIICGLSPEIAMTLQTMGVELQSVRTALSLEQALGMLGLEARRAEEEDDDEEAELDERVGRAPSRGAASPGAPVPFADMFGGARSRKRGSASEA